MKSSCVALLTTVCLTLATGCCGPLWQGSCGGPTCGTGGMVGVGCGGGCDSGCGNGCDGCGELYIDPWINDPASCCDPCDSCGNHNGQSCGKCRSVFTGVKSLWGYKCDDGCGTGCDSCAGGRPLFPTADLGGCDSCDGGGSFGHVSNGMHGSSGTHDGIVLNEGETIVHESGGRGTQSAASMASRAARNRAAAPARQIFQERNVNQPRQTLAY